MPNSTKIWEVLRNYIYAPSTPDNANKIAAEFGLPPGSVQFGQKSIEISEGEKKIYVQIKSTGDGVEILDQPPQ